MAFNYELYEKLKGKLGEEETRLLLGHIDKSIEGKAATKEDIQEVKISTKDEIQELKATTKADFHELERKIDQVKYDLIKWMVSLWAASIGIMTGIMIGLLRLFI